MHCKERGRGLGRSTCHTSVLRVRRLLKQQQQQHCKMHMALHSSELEELERAPEEERGRKESGSSSHSSRTRELIRRTMGSDRGWTVILKTI